MLCGSENTLLRMRVIGHLTVFLFLVAFACGFGFRNHTYLPSEAVGGPAGVSSEGDPDLVFFAGGKNILDGYVDVVSIFNVSSQQWLNVTSFPSGVKRTNMGAASAVLFGGGEISSAGCTSVVDIYNASSHEWLSNTTFQSGIARKQLAAASAGNLVVFGGGKFNEDSWNGVDIYDVSVPEWLPFQSFESGVERHNLAAASCGNLILFGGGFSADAGFGAVTSVVDIFNVSSTRWLPNTTLSEARELLAAGSAADVVIFAGGFNDNSEAVVTVDLFNVSSLQWMPGSRLETPRSGLCAASLGEFVLFTSGKTGAAAVEIFDSNTMKFLSTSYESGESRFDVGCAGSGDYVLVGGGVSIAPPGLCLTVVDVFNMHYARECKDLCVKPTDCYDFHCGTETRPCCSIDSALEVCDGLTVGVSLLPGVYDSSTSGNIIVDVSASAVSFVRGRYPGTVTFDCQDEFGSYALRMTDFGGGMENFHVQNCRDKGLILRGSGFTINSVSIDSCGSVGNQSEGGGGLMTNGAWSGANLTVTNCIADKGGCVYLAGFAGSGNVEISDSMFENCSALGEGGAIWSEMELLGDNLVFENSSAMTGGCAYGRIELEIENSTFSCAARTGGCVYHELANFAVSLSNFVGVNSANCTAEFGNILASGTGQLELRFHSSVDANSPLVSVLERQRMGHEFSQLVEVEALDAYVQRAATENGTTAVVDLGDVTPTSAMFIDGIAPFHGLTLSDSLGRFEFLSFSFDSLSATVNVSLLCEVGEGFFGEDCVACSAGHFNNGSTLSCEMCYKGAYQQDGGMPNCTLCPPGSVSGSRGALYCDPCKPGTWVDVSGGWKCHDCPAGTYRSTQYGCQNCSSATYASSPGSVSCVPCPDNAVVDGDGTGYVCIRGFYSDFSSENSSSCVGCPSGGVCRGGYLSTGVGFWRSSVTATVLYECEMNGCKGGTANEFLVGELDICADGYEDVLCGVCENGYSRTGKFCVQCAPDVANWMLLILLFAALVFYIWWISVQRGGSPSGVAYKIMMNHLQMVSFIFQYGVGWPSGTSTIADVTGAVSFSARIPLLACVLDLSYYWWFVVYGILPFVGLAVLPFIWTFISVRWFFLKLPFALVVNGVVFAVQRLSSRKSAAPKGDVSVMEVEMESKEKENNAEEQGSDEAEMKPGDLESDMKAAASQGGLRLKSVWPHLPRTVSLRTVILFIIWLFPMVFKRCVALFRCVEVEDERYLIADMSLRCYSTMHIIFMVIGVFMLLFLVTGIPKVIFFVTLFGLFAQKLKNQSEKVLSLQENDDAAKILLLNDVQGEDQSEVAPADQSQDLSAVPRRLVGFALAQPLNMLHDTYNALGGGYKRKCFYWDLVILVRRSLLLLMSVIPDVKYQLFGASALVFASMILQLAFRPFNRRAAQVSEFMSLVVLASTLGMTWWVFFETGSAGEDRTKIIASVVIILMNVMFVLVMFHRMSYLILKQNCIRLFVSAKKVVPSSGFDVLSKSAGEADHDVGEGMSHISSLSDGLDPDESVEESEHVH